MRLIALLLSLSMLLGPLASVAAAKKHPPRHHQHTYASKHATGAHRSHLQPATTQSGASQPALNRAPHTAINTSQLASELSRIVSSDSSNARIAVYVKSMKNGETLFTHNVNHSLTPASTMKILTAEAALIFLGPEYKFSTQLLTDAKEIRGGVLQGNLYVVLSGDPTLQYDDLQELLAALRAHHISAIAGNVYIDNTAYDQNYYGPGWIWKDKNYCYAAPIGASIINHNCLSFKVMPAKIPGHAAQIVTSPKYFYPGIRNAVVTKNVGAHACGIHLSRDGSTSVVLDGCMARGNYEWGVSYVVTDLPEYDKSLIRYLLTRLSVNVYGAVTNGRAPDKISLLGTHTSRPLRSLINDMLKKSDNVIAGALFKKVGQLYTREPGSWQNGGYAVAQILSRHAGMNTAGLRILDGSGLSPDNLTTPSQMMQVLDFAFHHYPTSYEFISALPVAGIDGTLKHRMGNIARKVRAKTGTISGVVGLAGYASSAEKEPLAFVIMINGSKGMGWSYKTIEDKIATALTRYKRT